MDYSPTGWYAVFHGPRGRVTKPVQAFDSEDGHALVVKSDRASGLSPTWRADKENKFVGLEPAESFHSVAPAAPGWQVRLTNNDEYWDNAVAAWLVGHDGSLRPVIQAGNGLEPCDDGELIPPPGQPSPTLPAVSPTGWVAEYEPPKQGDPTCKYAVERFADDGTAMTVIPEAGELQPVTKLEGFLRLTRMDRYTPCPHNP